MIIGSLVLYLVARLDAHFVCINCFLLAWLGYLVIRLVLCCF